MYTSSTELRIGQAHGPAQVTFDATELPVEDRTSTRLNSSHDQQSYAVFCWKKKTKIQ